jgi:hypothetical protein
MLAPNGAQKQLQTVTQWRYCRGCERSTPQCKVAGDTVWQCPWCGRHEPSESVQTSTQAKKDGP